MYRPPSLGPGQLWLQTPALNPSPGAGADRRFLWQGLFEQHCASPPGRSVHRGNVWDKEKLLLLYTHPESIFQSAVRSKISTLQLCRKRSCAANTSACCSLQLSQLCQEVRMLHLKLLLHFCRQVSLHNNVKNVGKGPSLQADSAWSSRLTTLSMLRPSAFASRHAVLCD